MSLEQNIQKEIIVAMKAKDKLSLETLRAIKAAILMSKTQAGASDEMSADDEIKLLTKLKKQRQEAATIFREQDRTEMAEEEEAQSAVIDRFLPKQLNDADVESIIKEIIATTGAESMKDMGKVMGMANKKMAGQADGKTISGMVKKLLS
jgi:uncharacterized protein YqeY